MGLLASRCAALRASPRGRLARIARAHDNAAALAGHAGEMRARLGRIAALGR